MNRQALGGSAVAIDAAGGGAVALVFVHGGACDRTDWRAQVDALSPTFKVITMDLPGHGESGMPMTATIDALSRTVVAAKDRFGGGRVVLVGHSMGCRVILNAYAQSSAGIVGLVFVDGSLSADAGDMRAAESADDKIRKLGIPEFLDFSFTQMFVATSDTTLRDRVVVRAKRWNPEFARAILLDTIRWDAAMAADALAHVSVPVLLLQSSYVDRDFWRQSLIAGMTTPWTELVQRRVANVKLQVIEGTGHFPHLEAAGVVNESIRQFAAPLEF